MDEKKSCIACGYEIPRQATLCKECGSYQQSFLNKLRYASGIAALFALIASSVVFIGSKLPDLYKSMFPTNRIRVIDLDSRTRAILGNFGNTELYVDSVYLHSKTGGLWKSSQYAVDKHVDPGNTVSLLNLDKAFQNKDLHFAPVRDISDKEKQAIIDGWLHDRNDCYLISYFLSDGASLALSRAEFPNQLTVEAIAWVSYVDPNGNSGIENVNAIGAIWYKYKKGCPDWEEITLGRRKASKRSVGSDLD